MSKSTFLKFATAATAIILTSAGGASVLADQVPSSDTPVVSTETGNVTVKPTDPSSGTGTSNDVPVVPPVATPDTNASSSDNATSPTTGTNDNTPVIPPVSDDGAVVPTPAPTPVPTPADSSDPVKPNPKDNDKPVVADPTAPTNSSSSTGKKPTTSTSSSATSGKNNTPKSTANATSATDSAGQGMANALQNFVLVSPSNPVELKNGSSIVSVNSGVATLADGIQVNLADLGATKNANGTYSITNKDGQKVTLPETGESSSILTILGGLLLGALMFFKRRQEQK